MTRHPSLAALTRSLALVYHVMCFVTFIYAHHLPTCPFMAADQNECEYILDIALKDGCSDSGWS